MKATMIPADIHGILLLDKPLGLSSAGAVARVKRLFNARKAGHTGSLDPLASGLLPICFGEATKFGAQLLDADKTYRVTVRLGERTPSADRESEVIERRELAAYSPLDLTAALNSFPREYAQVPPMHSALKQDGKPLYDMRLLGWQPPDLSFDVRCSKGTTSASSPRIWRRSWAPSAIWRRCAGWEWRHLVQNRNTASRRWNP
jgi:tRNA pseudouridine55 synthase